jgi:hypothetical protein
MRGRVCRICCWPLPAQSFSGPSPFVLATIFYCLRFETFLFVASYDSQGHGGGIRPRLHTHFGRNPCLKTYLVGPDTEHLALPFIFRCSDIVASGTSVMLAHCTAVDLFSVQLTVAWVPTVERIRYHGYTYLFHSDIA